MHEKDSYKRSALHSALAFLDIFIDWITLAPDRSYYKTWSIYCDVVICYGTENDDCAIRGAKQAFQIPTDTAECIYRGS